MLKGFNYFKPFYLARVVNLLNCPRSLISYTTCKIMFFAFFNRTPTVFRLDSMKNPFLPFNEEFLNSMRSDFTFSRLVLSAVDLALSKDSASLRLNLYWGQFYKTFTRVIYKCIYCSQTLKQWLQL